MSAAPSADECHRRANLALWNEWTRIHETADFYDVPGFKAGKTALRPLEIEELGDVRGQRLLHLQCHFGLDTLSWARLGATVAGVDFSEAAVALARRLAAETGLEHVATFVQSDVYELPNIAPPDWDGAFDIVFVSYGAIEWLPDLDRWAAIVARYLKPGGTFYMAEIHPFAQLLELDDDGRGLHVEYGYFPGKEPQQFDVQGSYADRTAHVEQAVSYSWQHSFDQILTALIGAGLRIHYLHEFPCAVAPCWEQMEKASDGWYYLHGRRDIPFLYSIKATKER